MAVTFNEEQGLWVTDFVDPDRFTYGQILHNARRYARGEGEKQIVLFWPQEPRGWTFVPESRKDSIHQKAEVFVWVSPEGDVYAP